MIYNDPQELTKGEGVGWKTTPNCEVRLKKLKMEVVPTTHEVDAGEIFDQTEVLHSLLPYIHIYIREAVKFCFTDLVWK